MKTHWRDLHPEEFIKRQVWLGESEAKLRAALLVAGEGMKSASGQANLGPEQFGWNISERQLEKEASKDEATRFTKVLVKDKV